jgi:hypothetical protein
LTAETYRRGDHTDDRAALTAFRAEEEAREREGFEEIAVEH